jgi:hypothetical protein
MNNMNNNKNIFYYFAYAGIAGFLACIAFAFLATITDLMTHSNTMASHLMSWASVVCMAAFMFTGFVLWIKAWICIFARWGSRPLSRNLLMILLCMVLSIFGGFILYFIHRSEVSRLVAE